MLAGSSYTVTGTLADIPLARYLTPRSATTAALTVLPGEPANIALATSKANYAADERDTTTITATIRDGAGNLVTDGTPVRWELRTSISDFVSTQDQTTAGQAVAVLRAPLTSDEQQLVECSADPASATTTITVNPVTVALNGPSQPLDLAGGQVANLLGTLNPGDPVPFLLATEVEIEGGPNELVAIVVPNLPTNVVLEGVDANSQLQLDAAGKGVFLLRITGGNLQVDLDHLQIDVAVVPQQQPQAKAGHIRLAFAPQTPSDGVPTVVATALSSTGSSLRSVGPGNRPGSQA